VTVLEKRAKDRRVQKTQSLLREALVSLIRERRYDSIVIKEILNRANVGRSTFYTHFRNKDELLVSGIRDILRSARASELPDSSESYEKVIRFSLPVFEYIDRHRHTVDGTEQSGDYTSVHEHLQTVLTELVADDIRQHLDGRRTRASRIPRDLVPQYVASSFILVLNWWVGSGSQLGPKEVNDLFRALIVPGLASILE
jgi:AcrR family transcriptional regulator